MKPASALLALALLFLALAGCAQEGGLASDDDPDAPLGPRQLRVGKPLLGEYVRIAINASGHRMHFEFDGGNVMQSVRPYEDHDYLERRIELVAGQDRFWADFPGIQYQQRLTDLDPEDGQTAIYNQQTTYRRADRYGQYDDVQTAYTFTSSDCTPAGCTQSRVTEDVDFRYYHQSSAPIDTLTPAGRVLTLGRTTSVNYTWTDDSGLIRAEWANYTAKKEVEINGQRAFLVDVQYESRVLNRPPTEKPRVGPGASTSDPPAPSTTGPRLPKPVREMYVTDSMAIPIKQVLKFPFEHNGGIYWYNTTLEVEAYEAGTEPVPWGNEPRQNSSRPNAAGVPLQQAVASFSMPGLTYGLPKAWANLRADPATLEFKRLSDKPGAFPMAATYFPDNSRNAFTWSVTMVDDGGNGVQAQSRLQGAPGGTSVYVVQDKESPTRVGGARSLSPEALGERTLAKGEDLYTTFRAVRPGTWQPAVSVQALSFTRTEQVYAQVIFADPSQTQPIFTSGFGLHGSVLRARNTVALSLFDAGLDSINMTWLATYNQWPMMPPFGTPVPPQLAFALQDARQVALLDRPWMASADAFA